MLISKYTNYSLIIYIIVIFIIFIIVSIIIIKKYSVPNSFTLAFQGPLTGKYSQTGLDELAGAKYAINVFQKSNPNITINLILGDDKGDRLIAPKTAKAIADNSSVIGVIGSSFSGASATSFPFYKKNNIPMISPSATGTRLTDPSSSEYGGHVFHRTVANDNMIGPALARWAIKDIPSSSGPIVYLISDDSTYGKNLATGIDIDIPIIKYDQIVPPISTTVLVNINNNVINTKTNVVIYCGYDTDAGNLIKSLRSNGYKGIFASGEGSMSDTFLKIAGSASIDTRVVSNDIPFNSIATPDQLADFTKITGGVQRSFNIPSNYVTSTINATNVFLNCIKQRNFTRETILNCINTQVFPDIIPDSSIEFDSNGDLVKPVIGAYIVDATGFKYVGIA